MSRLYDALALRLQLDSPPLHRWLAIGLVVIHLGGLAAIIRLTHQAIWLIIPVLVAIIPLLIWRTTRQPRLYLATLTPLALAYGVLGLRLGVAMVARWQGVTEGGLIVPQPYGNFLNMTIALVISLAWVGAAQLGILGQAWGRPFTWERSLLWLSGGVLVIGLAWAAITYLDVRARGVTASDPYAYVQMGYDFATTGSLEHQFALIEIVNVHDLPRYPIVPIGYLPPADDGQAATVWAVGYSVGLAGIYQLFGESGFYLANPILGLLSGVAVWLLAQSILREWARPYRWLAGSIAVFVLLTSLQQLSWLGIPMADVAAQLFTTLALWLSWAAGRRGGWQWALGAGLALGVAFAVRYTQVLIGGAMLYALSVALMRQDRRRWLINLLVTGLGAWLVAGWMLWYHQVAFGHPLKVGSRELELFGAEFVLAGLWRMGRDIFTQDEFGWLAIWLVWGMVALWHRQKQASIMLGLAVVAIVGFHVPYQYLRLRDLLSLYPILALWTGVGVADMLYRLHNGDYPALLGKLGTAERLRVGVLLVFVLAIWVRTDRTLQITAESFNNFGYLRAEQRASFDDVAASTPDAAIIGASLNSGAVMLYTERDIVRPYDWTADEWFTFIEATNRPIYLLIDGVDMQAVFDITQERYTLEVITTVPLPYFYAGGGSENQPVALYVLKKD